MDAASAAKIEIAVTLFEKGFAEDRVDAALQSCGTLYEALKWLRTTGARPSVAGSSAQQTPSQKTPQASPRASHAHEPQTTPRKQLTSRRSIAVHESISGRPTATPQRGCATGTPRGRRDSIASPRPSMTTKEETCQICFDQAVAGEAAQLACRHGPYCTECLRRHAEARIATGQIDVPCPECTTKVPERDLRRLLPAALVERLISRSLERAVSSIEDLHACPTPNCPMRFVVGEEEDDRMKCPTCRKSSCIRCGVQPYHTGLSCEAASQRMKRGSAADAQKQSKLFQQWMMKTGTKQCPVCHTAVSKQNLQNQGTQYSECHKMMCLNCSARFCFKCLTHLTDKSSCGCSASLHGFINPKTGKRIEHKAAKYQAKAAEKLKAKEKVAKAKASEKAKPAGKAKVLVKAKVKASAKAQGKRSGR